MFASVDRLSELEKMRRSIAMLNPRAAALDREEAMALLRELAGGGGAASRVAGRPAEAPGGRPVIERPSSAAPGVHGSDTF